MWRIKISDTNNPQTYAYSGRFCIDFYATNHTNPTNPTTTTNHTTTAVVRPKQTQRELAMAAKREVVLQHELATEEEEEEEEHRQHTGGSSYSSMATYLSGLKNGTFSASIIST